ncbi:uncharacterized protein si:dkey-15h8.17 isoform X1, partial [Tachysurus ichikawai]
MQLVLLCREQDFKYFGQDKVFSLLIKDLKDIECARKSHNFKNLCRTLAEKHQLLQAYLYAGNYFPQDIEVEKST